MARNGSGVYTLPEPAFVPNTPISSAAVNSDLNDIAGALTGSVAADGQTTITGALKLDNAGVVYGSDPNTGVRRTAADTQVIYAGGVDALRVTTNGVDALVPLTQNGVQLIPTGSVVAFTTLASVPSGWVKCDGANISRTTYAALFAVIGTTFGSGDGSTTFGVPQTIGKTIVTVDQASSVIPGFTTVGATGGAASQVIAQSQLPNVAIAVSVSGTVSGSVTSNRSDICIGLSIPGLQGGGAAQPVPASTGAVTSNGSMSGTMTGSTAGLGSNVPLPNIQPSLALIYIIKT